MSNDKTYTKLIQGCSGSVQQFWKIVQRFSPVVVFDPEERFFPVNLPPGIKSSSLFDIQTLKELKGKNNIDPQKDMVKNTDNLATTITSYKPKEKDFEQDKFIYPLIEEIYKNYASKAIPDVELTVYATVCMLKDTPNYDFMEEYPPEIRKKFGSLDEGYLINYYLYFPAMESAEHMREGDWSGISLLFKDEPVPILTCYFRKIGNYMITEPDSFCYWDDNLNGKKLKKVDKTHPVVYISKGRHNCYYDYVKRKIPSNPPWKNQAEIPKIENGEYSAPDHTLIGDSGLGLDEPLFKCCVPIVGWVYACATGSCKKFDTRGIRSKPTGCIEVEDDCGSGGFVADTQQGTNSYPAAKPKPGDPLQLKLNLVFVDLNVPIMKTLWGYGGYWGIAEVEEYTWWEGSEENRTKKVFAHPGGYRRPNLGPWFLWNLYFDEVFGSGEHKWKEPDTGNLYP